MFTQRSNIMTSDGGGSSTALNFSNRFGEEAYRVLENRFPELMQYAMTFKVIDTDHETGYGIGAFILRAGDNTVHIPVIMYDGDVSSCEMVYDKSSKLLAPLVTREAERIEQANQNRANQLAARPMVENTSAIFTNMYRPPRSTNVILASSQVDIAALPASAKKQIVDTLNANPDILAKAAEFYPLDQLTSKLAFSSADIAAPVVKATESTIIRVTDLLKMAESLTPAQKTAIVEDGYCIKQGAFSGDMVPTDQLTEESKDLLNITVITPEWAGCGTGYLLAASGMSLIKRKCVVSRNSIFTDSGVISLYRDKYSSNDNSYNRVVVDYVDGITSRDLEQLGWRNVKDISLPQESGNRLMFMVPHSVGGYSALVEDSGEVFTLYCKASDVRKINSDVFFDSGHDKVHASSSIDSGFLHPADGVFIIPHGAYVFVPNYESTKQTYLTLSGLDRILKSLGQKVTLQQDGPSYTLSTPSGSVTSLSEPDIAKVANERLGLSHGDFKQLKASKSVFLFPGGLKKMAFVDATPVETKEYINETHSLPQNRIPDVDGRQLLSAASEVQDKELFDLSMLASVSSNPDVRSTVLDSVSTFMEANSEIGTILLNMAVHEKEFDEFYGSERFVKLRSNLRRIFKQLGDIVNQLREFIVME